MKVIFVEPIINLKEAVMLHSVFYEKYRELVFPPFYEKQRALVFPPNNSLVLLTLRVAECPVFKNFSSYKTANLYWHNGRVFEIDAYRNGKKFF
jgi:hypothetical protein